MSRTVDLLNAIKNNTAYADIAQSRIEEILLAIKNNTAYTAEAQSRYEELVLAIKNNTTTTLTAQTSLEELLIAIANGTLDTYLVGRNILDKSKSTNAKIRNETATIGWATEVFNNTTVLEMLKPNKQYTIKYDVECVSVPEHDADFANSLGFLLYKDENSASYSAMDSAYLTAGESTTITKTFTTPNDLTGYQFLMYTNRYTKNGVGVMSSMIFSNIKIEVGSTATDYTPYCFGSELETAYYEASNAL